MAVLAPTRTQNTKLQNIYILYILIVHLVFYSTLWVYAKTSGGRYSRQHVRRRI